MAVEGAFPLATRVVLGVLDRDFLLWLVGEGEAKRGLPQRGGELLVGEAAPQDDDERDGIAVPRQ